MFNLLAIPYTLTLLTKYWKDSEGELRSVIEKKYHDLDEELVTKLFFSEFAFLLQQANQKKEFARAFLDDLRRAFPKAESLELSSFSSGLIADVSIHKHHEEKITGGDFGLTITRPDLVHDRWATLIGREYRRGVLVQAKIKRRNGRWGILRKRQKDVFTKRINYLALLLYSYLDEERRHLEPFGWQLCRGSSVKDIQDWLRLGKFPALQSSAEIIKQLGNAKKENEIGTDDHEKIEKYIRSKGKVHLEIRIFWPPNKKHPSRINIGVREDMTAKVMQKVIIHP